MAGAADGGDSARPSSAQARGWGWKGGRDRTGRFEGVRVAKSGAQTPRSSAIADAWTRSPATSGGMGVGSFTVEALETTVYSLNDFDSSLTR